MHLGYIVIRIDLVSDARPSSFSEVDDLIDDVLTSAAALALRRFGTRRGLCDAARRLKCRGRVWNTRVEPCDLKSVLYTILIVDHKALRSRFDGILQS